MTKQPYCNPDRRSLRKGSVAFAGAATTGLTPLAALAANGRGGRRPRRASAEQGGYGALAPVADRRDGAFRLACPKVFSTWASGFRATSCRMVIRRPRPMTGWRRWQLPTVTFV